MSDSNDSGHSESFFRKVARFVVHPTKDWTELNGDNRDSDEVDFAKSELKAMIERKRRNDFVRKREFDALRRVRREGLTAADVEGLENISHLDDSEARAYESARPDLSVKAKIDAIEQQMVGTSPSAPGEAARRAPAVVRAAPPVVPAPINEIGRGASALPLAARSLLFGNGAAFQPTSPMGQMSDSELSYNGPGHASEHEPAGLSSRSVHPDGFGHGMASRGQTVTGLAGLTTPGSPSGLSGLFSPRDTAAAPTVPAALQSLNPFASQGPAPAVEVTELVHDPDLDEAVIAFANADFEPCERMLTQLIGPGGSRATHIETWYVLFDLYRAIGQQHRFETLALDYAQRFGWSAPQWFSMPRLVADAAAVSQGQREQQGPFSPQRRGDSEHGTVDGIHFEPGDFGPGSTQIGWVAAAHVDLDTVSGLRSQLLQMPLPWVLDWRAVRSFDAQACAALTALLRDWADEAIEMQWLGGDVFFKVLSDMAPANVRDADPAPWLLRLEAMRLANQPVAFDQTAIDYCMTYEMSPPSWQAARCTLRSASAAGSNVTLAPVIHHAGVSTSFMESQLIDEEPTQVASVDLTGQLVGDISRLLAEMDRDIGAATLINVSCSLLIRIDFIAAGDLLNWVLGRRSEGRSINFMDAHRLVALFCGAMGINEHARVTVRHL